MYLSLSCVLFVLNKVSRGNSLKEKIINILNDNHFINITEMGFPKNWRQQDIWK
jgi:hypothetical protein